MLRALTSREGRRVAAWLVALAYFAGVVMPSAALAFGDGAASAYCFDEITAQVAALHVHVHVHADGTVHHHADHALPADHAVPNVAQNHGAKGPSPSGTHGHSHDADCCGSFGFAAVLPAAVAFHIRLPILTECLVGCAPDRIDRPPIALLSM
jgi:hypothetical protein